MWHFGTDSVNEYAGDEFEMTWEDGQEGLIRVYTKSMNDRRIIRKER